MKVVQRAALAGVLARAALACGGETLDAADAGHDDASTPVLDSTVGDDRASDPDRATDVVDAAVSDVATDATFFDGSTDATLSDAPSRDADGAPRDATLPPIDGSDPDARHCPDGGAPTLYLWSTSGQLWTFDPPSGLMTSLGYPCGPNQGSPYGLQMTAAADGTLYVLYSDWTVRQVFPSSSTCNTTAFVAGQQGFDRSFALAARNDGQVYLVSATRLGVMSPPSFQVALVGLLQPPLPVSNVDGTFDPAGRLFVFSISLDGGSFVSEVDPATGARLAETDFALGNGGAWAFTRWEQDFFIFVSPLPASTPQLWRFTPGASAPVKVMDMPFDVYGAASVRCIP